MDVTINPAFVLFCAVAPLLIAFVKQSGWSSQVNSLIALACYIVVGIAGALVSGQALTLDNAVGLITVATLVGSAAYAMVWSKLGTGPDGVNPSLDNLITNATSFSKG
jgi:predicted exporter